MRRAAVVVVALTALLGACGDSGRGESSAEPDPASECRRFVLFEDADWAFREAVDYPEGSGAWPSPRSTVSRAGVSDTGRLLHRRGGVTGGDQSFACARWR